MFFKSRELMKKIKAILGWTAGGVHKRIDENRELLEALQKDAPDFIATNPWVYGWLRSHDQFFCQLAEQVPLESGQFLSAAKIEQAGHTFPRPMPVKTQRSTTTTTETPSQQWRDHAYPLQQITIQLQGTRHSRREEIITQLETVLTRLRAGDMSGQEHDDDFGYRFTVEPTKNGLSFFDSPAASN